MPPYKTVLVLYVLLSLLALWVYGLDKLAARRGGRRVPEATLHLIALAGGWPGALVAMQLFGHKRRKRAFVAWTWLIVLLHAALWASLLARRAA